MTSQLEPSDTVRAAMQAIQENMAIHIGCGAEVTKYISPRQCPPAVEWLCQGCDRPIGRDSVMHVERASDVLVAYAISAVYRFDEGRGGEAKRSLCHNKNTWGDPCVRDVGHRGPHINEHIIVDEEKS